MKAKPRTVALLALTSCILFPSVPLSAQATLYYNRADHPGWYENTGWSLTDDPLDFTSNWIQGSIADFGGGAIRDFFAGDSNGNFNITGVPVEVAGLFNSGGAIRFDGTGNITGHPAVSNITVVIDMIDNPVVTGTFQFRGRTRVLGSYQIINGSVSHSASGGGADENERTITVTNGSLGFNTSNRTNSALTVELDSGSALTFDTRSGATAVVGHVTATNSSILAGSSIGGSIGSIVELRHIEGDADSTMGATPYSDSREANIGSLSTLTINQESNTVFAGTVDGFGPNTHSSGSGGNWLQLIKTGSGDLTLSGTIQNMIVPTLVEGGRLFINSASSSFGDQDNSTAILVSNGAAFGGTGVIGTLDGDHVIFEQGASLIAGLPELAGQTTFALGSGSVLDLSAAAGESGWLQFALGSADTAGLSYDQILISSGGVDIGDGAMAFSDFDFTLLGGFGVGTYTLLSSPDLAGSLAAAEFLSGELGGFDATLSLSGNDVILTVIPEPQTVALLFAVAALVIAARRRA